MFVIVFRFFFYINIKYNGVVELCFSLLALSFPECREEEPNKLGLSNGERKETEFQHSVILDIDIKEEPKYNHKHLKQKEISNSQSTMNIKRNDKEIEE